MKKFAYVFLIMGITFVVLSIGLTSYSNIKYNQLINSFQENKDYLASLEQIKEHDEKTDYKITEDMIGIIEIPSINLQYPIMEGTDKNVLNKAVGHFKVSALPGEGSNMTLIGHNNFILAEPFKKLDKVKKGELVKIITTTDVYNYEVTKIYTTDAYDKDVVKKSEDTKVTLITCTNDASKRLVVEAILVLDEASDSAEMSIENE